LLHFDSLFDENGMEASGCQCCMNPRQGLLELACETDGILPLRMGLEVSAVSLTNFSGPETAQWKGGHPIHGKALLCHRSKIVSGTAAPGQPWSGAYP